MYLDKGLSDYSITSKADFVTEAQHWQYKNIQGGKDVVNFIRISK